jgi:hypothetical protein
MDQKEAEEKMQSHLSKLLKDEGMQPETTDLSQYQSPLGGLLRKMFNEAERDRGEIEEEWINDLRQFKGLYDPTTLSKMHPKRSKAFLSITRTKVKTVTARVCDILFPANGERNWSVGPTPVPELDPNLMQNIATQMTQITGQAPTEPEIRNLVYDEAKRRADAMQREIEDQLTEVRYREIIRQVIHSGNLYGTGILKGPLVKRNVSKRWMPNGTGQWSTIQIESLSPYCEFIPIWDIFPDMSVNNIDDVEYIFQRHKMPRHKLVKLGDHPGFNKEAILAYLKENKTGDSQMKTYESNLSDLSQDGNTKTNTETRGKKYDVLEFWGYLSTDQLRDEGVEIDEGIGNTVAANVWVVGDIVIKAVVSPLEGANFPYHFYYFEKDETSIWGEGIPRIMRDPQRLFNSAVRAMLDNAANAAGPYIEANTDLLAPDEDPTDLYPFRVFQRTGTGVEAQAKAINVYDIPSHTSEFMGMVEFFLTCADEITTVPRYMYGDSSRVGGAGRTATGLSMLMGAANITIKDQIKNFDDGITKRFIRSMYFWNMDFNPKIDIKGDFSVKAEGTSSLVAKEVLTEQLMQWLNITNNPVDISLTNRDVALREAAKSMDLGEYQLVKGQDQIKFEQEQANAAAQAERNALLEIEKLKAMSSGHVDTEGQSNRPTMERVPPDQVEAGKIPQVTTADGQTL